MSSVSLRQLRIGGPLHGSFRYLQDWLEDQKPSVPEWHRGIVWGQQVQQRFAEEWVMGRTRGIHVMLGRLDGQCVFLDGLNSFHSVRQYLEQAEGCPSLSLNFEYTLYKGTADELRTLTYLLNRGSPAPWAKQELPK